MLVSQEQLLSQQLEVESRSDSLQSPAMAGQEAMQWPCRHHMRRGSSDAACSAPVQLEMQGAANHISQGTCTGTVTCVMCSSSRSPKEQAATDGCITSVPWGDAGQCSQGLGDGISSALGSIVIR